MTVSFSLVVTCVSLLFAAAVFLATLLVNVRDGDSAREHALSRLVGSAAALATFELEIAISSTIERQKSSGRSVRLLGQRVFGHSSPWEPDPSNSSHWTMPPLVERTYNNVFNRIQEGFWATKPANSQVTIDVYRWADGTAGLMLLQTQQQRGGMTMYRSDLNNGFWVDGMGGYDTTLPEFTTNFVWNLTTLKTMNEATGVYTARRTFVNGLFWNNTLMLWGRMPKPEQNWRRPDFSELSFGLRGLFYPLATLLRDSGDFPFLMAGRVIELSQFSERLSDSLLQKKVGIESDTNTSFAFLVDRRHSLVVSMASQEHTYERRDFILGVTKPDKNCIPFPPTKAMACVKNISTAPEFSLLKALLLAGNSSLEGEALDDGLMSSSNPMLSDPDRGGDLALNIITSSDDGAEYYAAVHTLALPTEQDLKLSLITFTPRDLFAAEAIRARNTAIGVAVAVSLVVILLMMLFLMTISSAVSELAEEMSDPLALLTSSTGEGMPWRGSSSSSSATGTMARGVLHALSNMGEIRVLQENFDICIGRIKELRGFIGKSGMKLVTGKQSDQSKDENNSGSPSGSVVCASSDKSGEESRGGHAAAASVGSRSFDAAAPQPRRVRFRDDLNTATEAAKSGPGAEDEDEDDNQQQKARAVYPIERRRQSKSDRFACVSISFPFVRKVLSKLALESSRDGRSFSEAQQQEIHSRINEMVFDFVAATAAAANSIVSHAHATSIEDLSLVGDETMCCCRLNSKQSGRRSQMLIGILGACIDAAFELKTQFAKPAQKVGEAAAAADPAGPDAAGGGKLKRWMSQRTVFVAVGVSGGRAVPLNHQKHQVAEKQAEDSSSGEAMIRPFSVIGPAVTSAHTIQRRMSEAGSMVYDSDICDILVRDSRKYRVPQPVPAEEEDEQKILPMIPDKTHQRRKYRVVFSIPFAIGIDSDLYPIVEPDYISIESVWRPAASRSGAASRPPPEVYSDEHRAADSKRYFAFRLAPAKLKQCET